jgi:hypothetical protein
MAALGGAKQGPRSAGERSENLSTDCAGITRELRGCIERLREADAETARHLGLVAEGLDKLHRSLLSFGQLVVEDRKSVRDLERIKVETVAATSKERAAAVTAALKIWGPWIGFALYVLYRLGVARGLVPDGALPGPLPAP